LKRAVIIFSGGIDSVCTCSYLKSKYALYGITFSYGQRANQEVNKAKKFAKILGIKKHRIVDISFLKEFYEGTNVLTHNTKKIPHRFDYSIVVPIRNAVFLTIASAWAFSIKASLVAYGAHKGDRNYPDCRPEFTKKLELALNKGEIDGIRNGVRTRIKIWSPFIEGLSKSELVKQGYDILGDKIFETWSCYYNKKIHCGKCESCNNRKAALEEAGLGDKTKYFC
jgi:7-cyano-7-deazaguanine synthase